MHGKKAHQRFPQKTQPSHCKAENSGTTQSPQDSGDRTRHTQTCDGQPRELSPAKHWILSFRTLKQASFDDKIPI